MGEYLGQFGGAVLVQKNAGQQQTEENVWVYMQMKDPKFKTVTIFRMLLFIPEFHNYTV